MYGGRSGGVFLEKGMHPISLVVLQGSLGKSFNLQWAHGTAKPVDIPGHGTVASASQDRQQLARQDCGAAHGPLSNVLAPEPAWYFSRPSRRPRA